MAHFVYVVMLTTCFAGLTVVTNGQCNGEELQRFVNCSSTVGIIVPSKYVCCDVDGLGKITTVNISKGYTSGCFEASGRLQLHYFGHDGVSVWVTNGCSALFKVCGEAVTRSSTETSSAAQTVLSVCLTTVNYSTKTHQNKSTLSGRTTTSSTKHFMAYTESRTTTNLPVTESGTTRTLPVIKSRTTTNLPVTKLQTAFNLPVTESQTTSNLPVTESQTTSILAITESQPTSNLPVTESQTTSNLPVTESRTTSPISVTELRTPPSPPSYHTAVTSPMVATTPTHDNTEIGTIDISLQHNTAITLSPGVIAGIIAGGLLFILLFVAYVYFVSSRDPCNSVGPSSDV